MNGISKESYQKATPELKDELMFDVLLDLHKKFDGIAINCPIQEKVCDTKFAPMKSINRLWAVVVGIPGMIVAVILIVKFVVP